jgi:hypothetical protein
MVVAPLQAPRLAAVNRLALYVGVVVTTIWGVTVCAALVTDVWPPVEIHGLMAMVVGAFFGKAAFDRAKDGRDD